MASERRDATSEKGGVIRWLRLVLAGGLCGAPINLVLAQEMQVGLEKGQRVRVTAPKLGMWNLVASFHALRDDSLVLSTEGPTLHVAFASVTRLEFSRGRKSKAGEGALIGLAAGLALGGVVGYLMCNAAVAPATCFASEEEGQLYNLAIGLGAGAVVGTLAGYLIGSRSHSEVWEPLPVDRLSVGAAQLRNGALAVQFAVRF